MIDMLLKWNKNALVIALVMMSQIVLSQTIDRAEYFIDSDPGVTNGQAITITTSSDLNENLTVDVSGLTVGNHVLYVRTRQDDGLWSISKAIPFFVQDTIQDVSINEQRVLVAAEYFIDEDPGVGKGTALPLNVLLSVDIDFSFSSAGLSIGEHTVYVRLRDNTGVWSLAKHLKFAVLPSDQNFPIPLFESDTVSAGSVTTFTNLSDSVDTNTTYKWDVFDDGSVDFTTQDISFAFDSSGLFDVRLTAFNGQDSSSYLGNVLVGDFENISVTTSGSNSLCEGDEVMLTAPSGYTAYVWNTRDSTQAITVNDAGTYYALLTDANGTTIKSKSVVVTVSQAFTASVEVIDETTGQGNGFAHVVIDGADANSAEFTYAWSTGSTKSYINGIAAGSYSVTITRGSCSQNIPVTVGTKSVTTGEAIATDIMSAEYFFDSDPGAGNGTSLNISTGSEVDFATEIDISSLEVGNHNLYLRTLGNNGLWSLSKQMPFYVQDTDQDVPISGSFNIVSAEYFVDEDPGIGSGTAVNVTNPTQVLFQNLYVDVSGLTDGAHKLYVRTQSETGMWSIAGQMDFQKCTSLPATLTTTDVVACPGENLTLSVSGTESTYAWYKSDTTLIDGQSSSSYNLGAVTEDMTFYVSQISSGGCQSQLAEINVTAPKLDIYAGLDLTISNAGEGFQLEEFFPVEGTWDVDNSNASVTTTGLVSRGDFTAGIYDFRYSVDSMGCVFTDLRSVEIVDLQQQLAATIDEESAVGTVIETIDIPNIVSYSIASGDDAAIAINSEGEITVANSASFDFETSTTEIFTIWAKESETLTHDVILTVTLIDQPDPPIFSSGTTASMEENTSSVVYTATTDDSNAVYSLGTSKDESAFTLSGNEVSFTNAPDFESPTDANADNVYLIDVIATSTEGKAATIEVAITVTDIDESGPEFTSEATTTVEENTTEVAYTITTDDPTATFDLGNTKDESVFSLSGSDIHFVNAPDFENPLDADFNNTYIIDINATDASGFSATLEVSITVTDVDESGPVFTSGNTASVQENSTDVVYTAETDDPVATYALGSSKDESLFTLSGNTINFTNAPDFESPQDENGDNVYLIDVIASNATGASNTLEVSITVTDVDESGPVFTSENTASVQENNTDVVYTAETDDPEVTYALGSSKDESLFKLSGNAINFTSAPDFENPQDENGDNVYLIDVIATDLSGNASTLEVAISVTDLDDQTVLGSERLATLYNYPNPVKNSFSLKGEAIQNGDVLIILSLDGKEMYQLDATTDTSYDVSNLQSGVYLIRLQRMGKTIAESRLIKK